MNINHLFLIVVAAFTVLVIGSIATTLPVFASVISALG